jgi:hypothetical protein
VRWTLGDGARLHLLANLSSATAQARRPPGTTIYAHPAGGPELAPWSVHWTLQAADA